MRISDDHIVHLLDLAVKDSDQGQKHAASALVRLLRSGRKASDQGQKHAASALVRLLRSGRSDMAALEELASDLASTWGPDIKSYYWQLCRKLGLCD